MNTTHKPPVQGEATSDYLAPLADSGLVGQTQTEENMVCSGGGIPAIGENRFPFLSAARAADELGWLGSYRIRGVLGEGGMGVVFDAEDSQLCRRVALKILKPELALTPLLRERFLQEARAAAALPSDHVVTIYQVGSESDVPFLAMQHLRGETLETYLHRMSRLSAGETARIGREIALGLAAAHEAGLIHRDIKPGNIWLEEITGSLMPRVKLLDFGLARVVGGVSNLTASGTIVGTPHYLAPEQARGLPLDYRCDLFSLGCVLYRMLTGILPFDGPDLLGLLSSLAVDEPRPILERAPETPPALVELIRQLLSKSPQQRPASARDVASSLHALHEIPTPSISIPVPEARKSTAPEKAKGTRFDNRRLLGGILGSILILVAVFIYLKKDRSFLEPTVDCSLQGHPIPVGVLQALSGPFASTSAPLVEATELAIDEINDQGGVLGSRIEPIRVDVSSGALAEAEQSKRLILENHVCALFGCCSAAGREQIAPLVEKHHNLLFYALPCEGSEPSPNVVYLGTTLPQQILLAVQFATGKLHKRRLFLIGSNSPYSRTALAILREALAKDREAEIVGEKWILSEEGDLQGIAAQIALSKADVLLNTLSGDANMAFFRALRTAGITPDKTPTLSFCLSENELRSLDTIGDYVACSYFQSVDRPENTAFVRKFQSRFGAHRLVTDAMESAYVAVHLWARAAAKAGDATPATVLPALTGFDFNGPGGPLKIDADNHYAWRVARIGQIGARGQITIVSSSEVPIRPNR